jgi:hypothetical protein
MRRIHIDTIGWRVVWNYIRSALILILISITIGCQDENSSNNDTNSHASVLRHTNIRLPESVVNVRCYGAGIVTSFTYVYFEIPKLELSHFTNENDTLPSYSEFEAESSCQKDMIGMQIDAVESWWDFSQLVKPMFAHKEDVIQRDSNSYWQRDVCVSVDNASNEYYRVWILVIEEPTRGDIE